MSTLLVPFSIKLPQYLHQAVVGAVRRGVVSNLSEFVRYAVNDMIVSGEYPAPPPLSGPLVHISFHITEWARRQLEDLVRRGVYSSIAEAIRAALWRSLNGAKVSTSRVVEREKFADATKATEETDATAEESRLRIIIPERELKLDEEMWYRVAPCITTLIVRATWEKYYIVDVECARERGVEV